MKRITLVVFWVAAFLALPVSSIAFEVGVRGYYWFPELSGNVKVDEGGTVGTSLDFEQDLGIDNDDFPSVELFFGSGKHHFSLGFTNVDYSGNKTLSRQITFNGQIYAASSQVTSSIDYDMFDLRYQYDLVNLENVLAGFSVGGIFHVKYLDGEVSLKTTGIDEKEAFNLSIPMVGLNMHLGMMADVLEARVVATGITYSGDNMFDLLGEISWTPFPCVDIHGGYRVFSTDIDEDDAALDYDMSGPYVTVTVGF